MRTSREAQIEAPVSGERPGPFNLRVEAAWATSAGYNSRNRNGSTFHEKKLCGGAL